MAVKRKAKKAKQKPQRKKRTAVMTKHKVKRKAGYEVFIFFFSHESLSLQRVPTLADAEDMVRRDDERRALREKAYDAEVKRLAAWRASAEYKALAERWAALYLAGSKPKSPAEIIPGRQSAFDHAWWPLPVAVAWVATRDRNFVEVSLNKSMRQLAVALAKYAIAGFKSASSSSPWG